MNDEANEKHDCFNFYSRLDRNRLICDKCGKIATLQNKKNPVEDFLANIDDGIDLDKEGENC